MTPEHSKSDDNTKTFVLADSYVTISELAQEVTK
jgi:hypothetical protein